MAKNKKYTSPKGRFKFPNLTSPDFGTDEFPKKDGELNTRLIMDKKGLDSLKKKLDEPYKKAIEEGKKAFKKKKKAKRDKFPFTENEWFTPIYDEEDEPTGEYEIKVKTKYSGKNKKTGEKWQRKLPIFDRKGNPVKKKIAIWGGTTGKVSFTATPYFIDANHMAGLSLQLEGVQVIDLVGPGERSAESLGFGEEEGEFEYDEDSFDSVEDDEDEEEDSLEEDTDEEDDIDF